MKVIIGDLLKQKTDYDIIIHGCNCFSTMGAGIARQIKAEIPEAFQVDINSKLSPIEKLGGFTFTQNHKPTIVNAYTQYGFRGKRDLEYAAVKSALRSINTKVTGKKIALPLIGAGLAGGNWEIIKKIIELELKDNDVTVIIWDRDVANFKYADNYVPPAPIPIVQPGIVTPSSPPTQQKIQPLFGLNDLI